MQLESRLQRSERELEAKDRLIRSIAVRLEQGGARRDNGGHPEGRVDRGEVFLSRKINDLDAKVKLLASQLQ